MNRDTFMRAFSGKMRSARMTADAPGGQRWKIAAVVRIIAKCAGKREEFREADEPHLQMCSWFNIARQ